MTLFALMCAVAWAGYALRQRLNLRKAAGGGAVEGEEAKEEESREGYTFSAVAGLLALLMGFTFTMAVDRFDARRVLVLEEANAIGTTYLRAQLLDEPHRARLSDLLVRYVDNRIVLGNAINNAKGREALARNDALVVDLWIATVGAWDSMKAYDFSSAFIDSMNQVIDLDASRKTARNAHVPTGIFFVLFVYMIVTGGVLGYVIKGRGGRLTAAFLLALFTLSLMLVLDIDRPVGGRVRETQLPMERLQAFLKAQPPASFDEWKTPAVAAAKP